MGRYQHRRKTTTGYSWQASDLLDGELGVNTADGTIHLKKSDNTVAEIGSGGGATVTYGASSPGSPSQGDLWIRSTDFRQFVYTGSEWVSTTGLAPNIIHADGTPYDIVVVDNGNVPGSPAADTIYIEKGA